MKILILANACTWSSWPSKIQAIKDFYAPLVNLQIDIQYTEFENIPLKSYPGDVTDFTPGGAVDVPGADLQIDQDWFKTNIGPFTAGYDILIFQTANVTANGLPLGINWGKVKQTWCIESFITNEDFSYILPGINGQSGITLGNEAIVVIEHEIAHAMYAISSQPDKTHEFFYNNKFPSILTDIKLPISYRIVSLYQQALPLLQQWLQLLRDKIKPMPTQPPDNRPDTVPPSNPDILIPDWSGRENARHNVRVICDLEGLTEEQKDGLSKTVHCESNYDINLVMFNCEKAFVRSTHYDPAIHGAVLSKDVGLCQINTHYHIGEGKDFPSVDYVLANPEADARWMARQWKAGNGKLWVCELKGLSQKYSA